MYFIFNKVYLMLQIMEYQFYFLKKIPDILACIYMYIAKIKLCQLMYISSSD